MTIDPIREQLERAGFAPDDAASRTRIFDETIAAHVTMTGRRPDRAWFVPGRIEIFGKHTDYAGGQSLVAAVPRGFAIVASHRDDGRVRLVDAQWRESIELDPTDHTRVFTGWTNYVAVVARRLAMNFPGAALGADIAIKSDVPRAAGVSSSSALVVGVASVLVDRGRLQERPEWLAAIRSRLDMAGYLGAVENGLAFPGLAGASGVGTHGGSEDHTAILASQPDRVGAYAYVPVRQLSDAPMPQAWRFIIMTSGVHADKAGGVRDRYNRASLLTRALLDLWQSRVSDQPSTLAAALASDPQAEGHLRDLALGGHGGYAGDDLVRRLAHFVRENARVGVAVEAFRGADEITLGSLSAASQHDASALLGNQVPETDALAQLAREAGAFAASSFGAGFGGSVWALVPADRVTAIAERWRTAYRAAHPDAKRIEWFAARPAPGAMDLTLSE